MASPALPEVIGGKYRVLGRLGGGAMGMVYAVEHVLTGERLALKLMAFRQADSYEAVERFKREARASAKIGSQHVVRVIDADVDAGGTPYLVMDLLEGKDLENLAGTTPQPPAAVIQWLTQVACGLDKAHRIGIIHRDLKPENIILTTREDGSPLIKIVDFGIAKLMAEPVGATHSGQILGTPLYMAPEQARGDTVIGPALDLYTLGLIAYRLLVGRTYWTAPTVVGIIDQLLNEPMVAPSARGSSLGPAFDDWFLRACARDPARRFASATDMIEQLAAAIGVPFPRAGHASDDVSLAAQQAQTESRPGRGSEADLLGRSPTLQSAPTRDSSRQHGETTRTSSGPMIGPAPGEPVTSSWLGARGSLLVLAATAAAMLLVGFVGTRWGERPSTGDVVSSGAPAAASATSPPSSSPAPPSEDRAVEQPSASAAVAPAAAPDAGPKRPRRRTAPPSPATRGHKAFGYDPLGDQK